MRSDARHFAAALLADHHAHAPQCTAFCYGTGDRVVVGLGAAQWIRYADGCVSDSHPQAGGPVAGLEETLNEFLDRTAGRWVLGYIGFGVHARRHGCLTLGAEPDLFLFTPEDTAVVDRQGLWKSGSRSGRIAPAVPAGAAAPPPLSGPTGKEFASMVNDALSWVGREPGRRLTVATRHSWSAQADLVGTMAVGQHDDRGLSRSFYFRRDGLQFAGTSPELLAEGRRERFVCNKLSGTAPRANDRNSARWDRRLIREHETAVDALAAALGAHAAVARGERQLLRLAELEHGLTQLVVEPKPERRLGDVLLDLVPVGASPPNAGLHTIARLERYPRGPYYGLVGYIAPDGRMSWSQLLRTVFARHDRVWLPVGSAVTALSTAELEVEEITVKASTVRIAATRN